MQLHHQRCAGLDVHKDSVVACVRLQEAGASKREVRTFETDTSSLFALGDWLESQGCTHVVMEATGIYWKPVWHLLEDRFELILANAQHVRAVPGRKTDVNDATWLADLLAHGLVAGSFVPPRRTQQLRDLTRMRKQLVREAASHVQRVHKCLEDANVKLGSVVTDIMGVSGRAILEALIDGESDPEKLAGLARGKLRRKRAALAKVLHGRVTTHHRFVLHSHLRLYDAVHEQVRRVDDQLDELLEPDQAVLDNLTTIPGVGRNVAQVIVAEIGLDMSRFPTHSHLVSWAGLCPRSDESAGRRRSTRIRHGNQWLRTTLVQAAWSAIRVRDTHMRSKYLRIRARRGAKKANVALAATLLTAAYYVIRRNEPYRELGADHYDLARKARTANRLAKRLEKLGFNVEISAAA